MRTKQKGFMLIELVAISATVAIIGAIGIYVWRAVKTNTPVANSTTASQIAQKLSAIGSGLAPQSGTAPTNSSSSSQQGTGSSPKPAISSGPSISATPPLAPPTVSELQTIGSGITVEPVFVPYCAPGAICPKYDLQFPYPYFVYATPQCPAGEICNYSIKSFNPTGPDRYNMLLPSGIYKLTYSSPGYTAQPFDPNSRLTVTANSFTGPIILHFYIPSTLP